MNAMNMNLTKKHGSACVCKHPGMVTHEKLKKKHVFLDVKPVYLEPSESRFDTG